MSEARKGSPLIRFLSSTIRLLLIRNKEEGKRATTPFQSPLITYYIYFCPNNALTLHFPLQPFLLVLKTIYLHFQLNSLITTFIINIQICIHPFSRPPCPPPVASLSLSVQEGTTAAFSLSSLALSHSTHSCICICWWRTRGDDFVITFVETHTINIYIPSPIPFLLCIACV